MAQEYKSVYWKKMEYGGRKFYVFKEYDKIDRGKWNFRNLRVTSDRQGKNFIIESGATNMKKAEKQIKDYLKRRYE